MIRVITYGDEKYKATQKYCAHTAYKYGADKVYEFGPNDIEQDFKEKNQQILALPRGNGYWLWKPYFINRVLKECEEEDWVIYTDSALYFNRSIRKYIEKLAGQGKDFVVQETKFQEKQFTKADILWTLKCNEDRYLNSKQLAATVIILKNCIESRRIVAEWLNYSQDKRLITDDISRPNCDEFVENRHDQSILSLICKQRKASIDNNLFCDIVLPFHRKALLTYHHSVYAQRYRMFIASVIRVIKYIL